MNEINRYLAAWSRLAPGKGFQECLMGEVGSYPVPAYATPPSASAGRRPVVYVSSGVHGDEPSGPQALLELLQEDFFDQRAEWQICPMLNPVGMEAGTRENGEGVDLNRDYLNRLSIEARIHVAWLEQQPVPELFVSLHEDWESSGFYLYEINAAGFDSGALDIISAASSAIAPEPEVVIDDHEVKARGWIDHPPSADWPKHWPEAIYMAERGVGVSYTLETPSSEALQRRVACHKLALKQALEGFLLTWQR